MSKSKETKKTLVRKSKILWGYVHKSYLKGWEKGDIFCPIYLRSNGDRNFVRVELVIR